MKKDFNLGRDTLVRISNQFQQIVFTKFNAKQIDLFWVIASKVANHGTETVSIGFDELRKAVNLKKNMTEQEFRELLRGLNKALLETSFEFEDDEKIYQFTLFNEFDTYKKEPKLEVSVMPRFAFLLNSIVSNYTLIDVETIVSLRSRYSKDVYRHLRQYRSTGVWRIGLEDFYNTLGVPEKSRRRQTINSRVLAPIQKELGDLMGLRIKRLHERGEGAPRRGVAPLVGFEFHFDKELPRRYDDAQKAVIDGKAKDAKTLPPAIDYDRGESEEAKAEREAETRKTKLQADWLKMMEEKTGKKLSLRTVAMDATLSADMRNYVEKRA